MTADSKPTLIDKGHDSRLFFLTRPRRPGPLKEAVAAAAETIGDEDGLMIKKSQVKVVVVVRAFALCSPTKKGSAQTPLSRSRNEVLWVTYIRLRSFLSSSATPNERKSSRNSSRTPKKDKILPHGGHDGTKGRSVPLRQAAVPVVNECWINSQPKILPRWGL
jgi:hypothetical protein